MSVRAGRLADIRAKHERATIRVRYGEDACLIESDYVADVGALLELLEQAEVDTERKVTVEMCARLEALREAGERLADEAARAVTEPRRFHMNEDGRQQALSRRVAGWRAADRHGMSNPGLVSVWQPGLVWAIIAGHPSLCSCRECIELRQRNGWPVAHPIQPSYQLLARGGAAPGGAAENKE